MRVVGNLPSSLLAVLSLLSITHAVEQGSWVKSATMLIGSASDANAFGHGDPIKTPALRMLHKPKHGSPQYHYADALSAATDGFLDWFVVIYWGAIILFIVLAELMRKVVIQPPPSEEPLQRSTSLKSRAIARSISNADNLLLGPDNEPGRSRKLAPNIFALNLIASHGDAVDRDGKPLSPKIIFTSSVLMGLLQLFTLFLVLYDIDPTASPYTEKPAAAWKKYATTVNAMKVVMVFFLGMHVFSEAADAFDNYIVGMALKNEELLQHRFFVLFIPFWHYLITLSVILTGVSVVLSCQSVPSILFSSMAILFITQVDELFWGFYSRTFEVTANWKVFIRDADVEDVRLFKRCIIMFPMVWGFALLGRAWYRDQMPAFVVHTEW